MVDCSCSHTSYLHRRVMPLSTRHSGAASNCLGRTLCVLSPSLRSSRVSAPHDLLALLPDVLQQLDDSQARRFAQVVDVFLIRNPQNQNSSVLQTPFSSVQSVSQGGDDVLLTPVRLGRLSPRGWRSHGRSHDPVKAAAGERDSNLLVNKL